MAATASFVTAGLVSYSITVGGENVTAINDTYRVLSISVSKGVNAISTAQVVLIDGDMATAEFPVTDSDTFEPGTPIDISVGYDNVNKKIFSGIVTGYQLGSQGAQGVKITVSCKDKAVKLSGVRQTRAHKKQPVSDTITEILGKHPGLGLSSTIAATTDPEQAVQQDLTDWDYIVTRAEMSGQVVVSDQGQFETKTLATLGEPVLALEYGTNVYSFSLQVDARTQLSSVTAQSWSLDTGEAVEVTAKTPDLKTPGNVESSTLADALGQTDYKMFATADIEQGPLQKMADTMLAKRTLAKVQGTVETPGVDIAPGSLVSLSRIGKRFSGNGFVSKVAHAISGGDWKTTLTLGMNEKWFAETKPDVSPSAETAKVVAGGANGLYKAVVKAIQPDDESKYRVQITLNDLDKAELWARLAQPYATDGAGMYFFPEVGDQVIVGFLGGASSSPIILGSVYTKNRKPAYTPDDKNSTKAIVTKNKLTLEFDDDKKIITLKTPAGNKLVISDADGGKGLALTDQQGNTVTLSDQGISVVSKSTLSLKADQDLTLESTTGNVSIKGAQGATVKAPTVSVTADASLTLKSSGVAELSASATTTVKGAIVMIN
ncbi:type VI secretion system tip protein VgrG [Hymenobacter ruricola]|uniref:Type VI secretion system tip protein VgrG n=1 Tax=Hymenobacter ruricola TaxID=2791023 RepID=A0ABS0I6S2_9BACT|nr:type VI secretion system tip protein VgrG [Hymenobacter ruricola]MBF9222671.1 type VI secretion system tip protein VgrG [Hymenobacter ruricola]